MLKTKGVFSCSHLLQEGLQESGKALGAQCKGQLSSAQVPAGLQLSTCKEFKVGRERVMLGKALGRDGRLPKHRALVSLDGLPAEPPTFITLPWVKQFPQPRLGSKNLAGQVSSGEHSCLLCHQDMPLLRGREELLLDQTISAIVLESIRAGPSLITSAVTQNTFSMDDPVVSH